MGRTRPHVKVHISVADHPKTSEVWADLAMRGMLVELWRKAGEKFAGKTEDRVPLKPTDRMDIAGTTDQARADQGVTELCARVGYELRRYPNRWVVKIRKFAKKQGFQGEELSTKPDGLGQELSPPNPNPNPNPIPNPKKRERAPSAPPAARAPSPSKGKTPCPEGLDPEAKERLRKWAAGRGIDRDRLTYGWQAIRDWAAAGNKRQADWEATFRNALRKGWCLEGYAPPAGAGGTRYAETKTQRRDREEFEANRQRVLAERKQAELDDPEAIGRLIDLALHREVAS